MNNQFKGTIKSIGETVDISDRFRKRTFVIEDSYVGRSGPVTNPVEFTLVQEKCDMIDNFTVGQKVVVNYDLDGREWEKDGVVKYFHDLRVWRIEEEQATDQQQEPATKQEPAPQAPFPGAAPAPTVPNDFDPNPPAGDGPDDLPF